MFPNRIVQLERSPRRSWIDAIHRFIDAKLEQECVEQVWRITASNIFVVIVDTVKLWFPTSIGRLALSLSLNTDDR